jgi:hypothetical protein
MDETWWSWPKCRRLVMGAKKKKTLKNASKYLS